MKLLAIDPGNEKSAWVLYDTENRVPEKFSITQNDDLISALADYRNHHANHLVIEMVASYGMAVGREVFETVFWIGRFYESFDSGVLPRKSRLYRRDVKMHLCGCNNAKDSNIRQALIDRYGPGKDKAIGTKKSPGPLYGVSKDVWAALALAVTWSDTRGEK